MLYMQKLFLNKKVCLQIKIRKEANKNCQIYKKKPGHITKVFPQVQGPTSNI